MSSFLAGVDARTSLAGMNRMELLLFTIKGSQLFGINVFKVREVISTPEISPVPMADPRIVGVADIRGLTMPMIDLAKSLNLEPVPKDQYRNTLTIVTEFNSSVQGFLVEDVDRIVHMDWAEILPPPESLMGVNYLTGVTRAKGQIVEIVDVEKVLSEVAGITEGVSTEDFSANIQKPTAAVTKNFFVLGADDSAVARAKLKSILDKLGVQSKIVSNGKQALDQLERWAEEADMNIAAPVEERVLMVISDIEMPEMDGYTLTSNIRKNDCLNKLFVVLNSSLSGNFNDSLTDKVGADVFLSKWNSEELARTIIERITTMHGMKQP